MGTEQKNSCFRLKDDWNQLADIDIKVVRIGFAEDFLKWPFERGFSQDEFYRLYFAVSGSFRIIYPAGACVIEPGSLYLIPCNTLLKYEGITPCTHYWIHFASNRLKTIPRFNEPMRLRHILHTFPFPAAFRKVLPAAELLCRTDLPLREISGKCGFSSVFSFSRAFRRREYGVPPSLYRRNKWKP